MNPDAGESSRSIEWLTWFEVNKFKLLILAIASILAVIGMALYRAKRAADEQSAWSALALIEISASRNSRSGLPSPESLLQVAAAHPGTEAALQAVLLAGQSLYELEKYPEARSQFERVIRGSESREFEPTASFGIAACFDSEGKTAEAMTAYQGIATKHRGAGIGNQASLAIGRIHESRNEFAQALKVYDELIRPNAMSEWSRDAIMRRELLLMAHPELTPTNQPPAASSAAAPTNLLGVISTNPAGAAGKP
jgi:predicted negative regulator of RcsB-dependent stress response